MNGDATTIARPDETTAPRAAAVPTVMRRAAGGGTALGAAGVLGVAAVLDPAGSGLGTHEQLNLPACGWISLMDLPCPTCGMTTAFAHAADGNLLTSFLTQPLGFLLALATAMALLLGLYIAATGSAVAGVLPSLWGRRMPWILLAILIASWGWKVIAYKEMLP